MQTASRYSILLLIAALALVVTSTATAAGRRGAGPGHPGSDVRDQERRSDTDRRNPVVVDRVNRGPQDVRQARRGCRRGARLEAGVRCDYYYDDDDDSEGEAVPTGAPSATAEPQQAPAAAKIAPVPESENIESFTPSGGEAIREKLIAARKNWLQKKSLLDDANAARAKAEYQAYETGGSVDPAVLSRQQVAKQEAAAAHAALGPLVEEGREAGISAETLRLYERANTAE